MDGVGDKYINHPRGKYTRRACLCKMCLGFFTREKRAQGNFCNCCIEHYSSQVYVHAQYKLNCVLRYLETQIRCWFCFNERTLVVLRTGQVEKMRVCKNLECIEKLNCLQNGIDIQKCKHNDNALKCANLHCRKNAKRAKVFLPLSLDLMKRRAFVVLLKILSDDSKVFLSALNWNKHNGLTDIDSVAQYMSFSTSDQLSRFYAMLGIGDDPIGVALRKLIKKWPTLSHLKKEIFYGALVQPYGQYVNIDKLQMILREDKINVELLNAMLELT